MEKLLLIAGLVLLVGSCFGILKFLLRLAALACIAAGIWYWYHGGREEMTRGIESGRDALVEKLDPDNLPQSKQDARWMLNTTRWNAIFMA